VDLTSRKKNEPDPFFCYAPASDGTLLADHVNNWYDYVWLNGRVVTVISNGGVFPLHDDQTGRPLYMTDPSSHAIDWAAQGLPFDRNVTTNRWGGFNIGFPGQYWDAEDDLWQNGNRDYDPSTGRYIESDPIGLAGGVNTYAYAEDNPISSVDPYGLWVAAFGISGTIGHWFGFTAGMGYVFDSSGNYGTYQISGQGVSSPLNASVGVSGSFFGALPGSGITTTINDFAGYFDNGSFGVGADGASGAIDGYINPNNMSEIGLGATIGAGTPGVSVFAASTCTSIHKGGNIWQDFSNAWNTIMTGQYW